jgi:hypothetical protein
MAEGPVMTIKVIEEALTAPLYSFVRVGYPLRSPNLALGLVMRPIGW